jgi:LmbE family N-acetylglucosaminyl deacetylase
MQHLAFVPKTSGPFEILCLGAHSDDIEIGAGGTILTLLRRYPAARVHWVVFAATHQREAEARNSAADFLSAAGQANIEIHDFPDGFFPDAFARLKRTFEALKSKVSPDLIFSHTRHDHHQDHRIVADLTWNTFRDHLILGYEVIKYDPDLGNPNLLVPLDRAIAEAKVGALMTHFRSQSSRRWFVPETFMAVMQIRGVHAAAPSGLAEGFYAPKMCI